MRRGMEVVDLRTRERCVIRSVEHVTGAFDLFGNPVPAHKRYIVEFPDGRWQNDRVEGDLVAV